MNISCNKPPSRLLMCLTYSHTAAVRQNGRAKGERNVLSLAVVSRRVVGVDIRRGDGHQLEEQTNTCLVTKYMKGIKAPSSMSFHRRVSHLVLTLIAAELRVEGLNLID